MPMPMSASLKAFDRARFGRRSEKLGSPTPGDEQQAFVFEEIEIGIAAIKAQVTKGGERPDGKRPPRPRKGFAPHLERVEVVIEPEDLPENAGKQEVLIGEDVSERLDVVPAKFRVIVTRRPKYALKNEDGVMVHETDRVRANKIRALVRDVLLRDWDPIGISDIPEAKDEYDAYAEVVLGMLINENATAEDIASYLFKIATEHMALSDREMAKLCERAAAAIVALRSN